MLPARIENPTATLNRPQNWNEQAFGHCAGLPIRMEEIQGVNFMRSAWEAEPDEALYLAAGGKIILGVSAPRHPVVLMVVEPPPEQLTRTTLVREEINQHGRLTVVVETLFPPLPGLGDQTTNRARCQVEVGDGGSSRAVWVAMEELEKLAVAQGWVPA